MKKLNLLTYVIIIILIISNTYSYAQVKKPKKVFGQELQNSNKNLIRCVTVEYEAYLKEKFPKRATIDEFEKWIAPKIEKVKLDRLTGRNTNTVINIPVVVHVIHNGDNYGTGENITDEQVLSQITVLNQDFRRMINTPGYNTNSVGADVEIEFCMAQQDPEGNETTGIDRVNLNTESWGESAVENTLKPQTQWDPERYFNIWVCRFGGDLDGILGYAHFPDNSGLGGIDASNGNSNTDGVIIGYQYFGSTAIYPSGTYEAPYNRGRTATHEIGHCFGLRHIWGDNSSCTVNATDSNKDYCPDTPAANTAHYECETGTNTCTAASGNDMVENYMDYSDDSCMNIFTLNQKDRILAVLQNSPRRASLTTSNACSPAQVFENDGSLHIETLNTSCETAFVPVIKIENKGSNNLTTAIINYSFDDQVEQTFSWTGNLATGQYSTINLPLTTLGAGSHTIFVSIAAANNNADQNNSNDSKSQTFSIISSYDTPVVTLSLQKDYYGSETTWSLTSSTGTVVASGGPYTDTTSLQAVITQNINVNNNTCYTFTINDAYGDGICCDYGSGYYNLKTNDNTVIASGAEFLDSESHTFRIDDFLSSKEYDFTKITIYPNPVTDDFTINVNNMQLPESYKIYSSLGQLINSKTITNSDDLVINAKNLSSGIYYIIIASGTYSKNLKFIKK